MANDDIREILCAALSSEEAFTIIPLTDTEVSDLSYVLVKALAAQGAPPAETCAWMWIKNTPYGSYYQTGCGCTLPPGDKRRGNFCCYCGKRIEEADDD